MRWNRRARIVAFYSLIHLERGAAGGVLTELTRVLIPGGLLLLAFHGGEGEVHADDWFGRGVSIDATLYQPTEMARALRVRVPDDARLRGRSEAVATTLADDEARMREVPGQDQRAGVGMAFDERTPCRARLGRVVAEAARPLGLGHLHRPVHEVTGEHGAAGGGREAHADVARRVADPRLEAEMLVDREHYGVTVVAHRPKKFDAERA